MNNRITPFIRRMRTKGGTIYTFSSSVEDIGLNINERNNIVRISHFALLDIPPINDPTSLEQNRFNISALPGAFDDNSGATIKDGRVLIAESFQNYALNLESNFINRSAYDSTLQKTVSERVFWKWMKESGAIRWKDPSGGYHEEESDADPSPYTSVVKYLGLVSAGNVRSDSFGTYNETYILIPTSHGRTRAFFQEVEDPNYSYGITIGNLGENILGRENWTRPHPDLLSFKAYYDFIDNTFTAGDASMLYWDESSSSWEAGWWYTAQGVLTPTLATNTYLTDIKDTSLNTDLRLQGAKTVDFRRSNLDCMSLVWNLDELKTLFGDSALTYDRMAIEYAVEDEFGFNSALIYYSVYNSTGDTLLATNLLGILFLDNPTGNTLDIGSGGIEIPSLEKIQSGPTGFGTSYSLRLNIKTENIIDDTGAPIVDFATSDQELAADWSQAFYELQKAVNILSKNSAVIESISNNYQDVIDIQSQILNQFTTIQQEVNQIDTAIEGDPGIFAIFGPSGDTLIESSIYTDSFGRIGVFTDSPSFSFQVEKNAKMKEITIENAIRDTGGNIILGYGSPLQLGASTGKRDVEIYTGLGIPVIRAAQDGSVYINGEKLEIGDYLSKSGGTMTGLLTLDSGFSIDSVTIDSIDASLTGSPSAIATTDAIKTYVDNRVIEGVTASNGLYEDGSDIRLGGDLIQDTSINVGAYSFLLDDLSNTRFLLEGGLGLIRSNVGENYSEIDNSGVTLRGEGGSESAQINLLSTGDLEISFSNSGIIYAAEGLKYSADLSSTFVDRSLVDKEYVDSNSVGAIVIVDTSVYTVGSGNDFIGTDVSAGVIYLPATPSAKQKVIISDVAGTALSNPITIEGNGNLINGASSAQIDSDYGSLTVFWNGTFWSVIAIVS